MEKEFRDIYYKIYNENGISNMEEFSQKRTLNILKMFGMTMLGALIFPVTVFITMPVFIIYASKISSKKQIKEEQEYKALYKEKLIVPLFQEIFENVQYIPNEGIALNEYLEAEYEDIYVNKIKKYSSNDHIIFPIEINGEKIRNLDIYDVELERDAGNNRTITIFEGLTGSIELSKNIQTKIMLNTIGFSDNENIMATDMYEFDNYFSILAENKILAMRIFTSDVMEKIIDILKDKKCIFNINIINNKLYVRIPCFCAFESTIVLGKEKCEAVKQDFIAVEVIKELVCLIYKIIDNIEI